MPIQSPSNCWSQSPAIRIAGRDARSAALIVNNALAYATVVVGIRAGPDLSECERGQVAGFDGRRRAAAVGAQRPGTLLRVDGRADECPRGDERAVYARRSGQKLLGGPYVYGNGPRQYDVSRDDLRFLMIKQSPATNEDAYARLILVQHWFEELKRRVPTH